MGDTFTSALLRLSAGMLFCLVIDWTTGLTIFDFRFWALVIASGVFWCAMEVL